ncbi:extensin [Asticcacaulis biprosthecium C19]|uniref:Extensin n=1 Tax=Asticcacaulis biprosthecium C19 TaxID=715226 RepID=F4QIR5_9CAUL|nr:hypothetical protein [Asticcacaulis biprosthecium]EGF91824.1 extensin [Asticcacaulis biprosthecium C19]
MRSVLALLLTAALAMASPVLAEGSGHPYTGEGDAEATPKPKPKPRKAKPKPAVPAPKLPDAPIPYTQLGGGTPLSPDMAKALTPTAAAHVEAPPVHAAHPDPAPVHTTHAPVHIAEVPPPPPPPPPAQEVVVINPPPPAEINLKCETTTSRGKKTVSTGIFYIAIVPSPVFPDEEASFQFRFVDPAHTSLVRDTVCQDISCQARVSPSTYSLVNMTTKGGDALRITLDRTRGSFYAEAIDDKRVGFTSHLGEQGWCAPEPKATKALF